MASEIKYLTLDGLKRYTGKIKSLIPEQLYGTKTASHIKLGLKGRVAGEDGKYTETAWESTNMIEIPLVDKSKTLAGLMSPDDKTKLDSISNNFGIITDGTNSATANVYQDTINFAGSGGTTVTVSDLNNNAKVIISSPAWVEVGSDGTGNAVTEISTNGFGIKYTLGKTFSESGHTHAVYDNQNAFSNIIVGTTTVAANSATDTVTFDGAGGLTIAADETNNKITFTAPEVEVGSDGTGNAITSINKNGHGITYTLGKTFVETTQLDDYYTKGQVDEIMVSAVEYCGTITALRTATNNPAGALTPAATKGNVYVVKGQGYINGEQVEEGDMFIAKETVLPATRGDYKTIQHSWNIVNVNWNVVNTGEDNNGRLLPQNGTRYPIAIVGGHPIYVGVEQNTTTGGITNIQTPSHGSKFSIVSGGSFSGNTLTFNTNEIQLPSETTLTASSSTTTASLSHGDSFTVVNTVTGANHEITDTRTTYTLPSETPLTKGTDATATATITDTFTTITDYDVSGHTITATKTTYTLPNVTVTSAVLDGETPGHGGTFNIVSAIETLTHGIKYTTKQITLPDATINTDKNVQNDITTTEKYFIVGSTSSTATTGTLVKRTNVFVDENGILNCGSTKSCASKVTNPPGTMVITCNDAITDTEIDTLFA